MKATAETRESSTKQPSDGGAFASGKGFTIIELLVVLAMVVALAGTLLPALAKARPNAMTGVCRNNLKQLTAAWKMYSFDYKDSLVAAQTMPGRPLWVSGNVDFSGSNLSNWDTNQDMVRSPLWVYAGRNPALFRCPDDLSAVNVSGVPRPRLRSYSMSQVFGTGEWLDQNFNAAQTVWRIYGKGAEIVLPSRTFVFLDEHPNSINDAAFANACTGAQTNDSPGQAKIIDYPASYHNNGACVLSFADGRSETHKWLGSAIKPPINYGASGLPLNVSAGDSAKDIQWLAANTTVRR